MSRKRSKYLSMMLALSLFTSAAAGCGTESGSTGETTPPSQPTASASGGQGEPDKSPITFSMYIPYKWYDHKWDTDIAKYITEQTGVTMDFQIAPVDNGYEKLDMMIASASLPDMVLVDLGNPTRTKLEQGGLVVSIDELCEKGGSDELKKNIGDFSLNWFKTDDGNTYVIPNFVATPEMMKTGEGIESNYVYGVREDMYKAVGSPDTSTPEGFIQMLKDVKEKFPEVDGKSLIPFLFTDPGKWSEPFDGTIAGGFNASYLPAEEDYLNAFRPVFVTENFKEACKFVNTLVREGLAPKEYYTYKPEQIKELKVQGRVFCIAGHSAGDTFTAVNDYVNANPEARYVPIEYPRNSKGEEPRLVPSNVGTGWNACLVTTKCKDIKRAAQFLTYTTSEAGDTAVNWGVEGVHYTGIGEDGVPVYKQEVLDARANDYAKVFQNQMGFDSLWLFGTSFAKFNQLAVATRDDAQKQRYEMSNKYAVLDVWFNDNNLKPDATSPEGLLYQKLSQDIKARALPKILLANTDEEFEKEWNNMVEKINSEPGLQAAYDKVMEIANENYNRINGQ